MKLKASYQNAGCIGFQFLTNNPKIVRRKLLLICSIILVSASGSLSVLSQPSGGPYGPVQQTYEIPEDAGQIYYVAPDGETENKGETANEPTTLETAVEKVKTGDVIILRGGVYRTGNLILNQGITLQPYADEHPVLKGSYIASEWKDLRNGLWITSWPHIFPSQPLSWWRREREGKKTPLHRFNNDMVFIDGKFLQSAGWEGEVDENSFYIDYNSGIVYIGQDPSNRLVEITAFDVALHRVTEDVHGKKSDKKGPVIKGITFTQYANRAIEIEGTEPEGLSDESEHGKEVVGTVLENCEISYCSRVAAFLRGDNLVIRHCKISNTSTEGIYIIGSSDVLLEKNIFTRNNIERITGYYPAAVKIFNQCYRVTCNDNLVIDLPYSNGIWYDVGNVDGVFINNWVEGVGQIDYKPRKDRLWPSDNGFFFEISKGAVCAGNVFVNCDHGVTVLNSSDVQIYQNTFVNSIACIGRTARGSVPDHFGWHPSTGPDVNERDGHVFVNNLLTGVQNFQRPLFFVWQPDTLCDRLPDAQLKKLDNNVYVRDAESYTMPLILWSPAANNECQIGLNEPMDIYKMYNNFSAHSKLFKNYNGPLFKSTELGNYQLLHDFPAAWNAVQLPEEIKQLLKYQKEYKPFVGAYAPIP